MGRLVGIVGVVALLMGGFVIAPQSVTGASAMNASPATVPIPAGRIAYVGTDNKLHVMNGDGSGDMIVPTQGKPSYPRWSPKTEEIAFVEQLSVEPRIDRVAVVNPATASTRVLVGPEIARVNPDQYFAYHHIGWTPDGSGVLYRKNGGNRTLQFLMRVDAAGGTPQAQGYACTTCGFDISPTDGRIAMVENSLSQPIRDSRLFIFNLDGSNMIVVLPFGYYLYSSPAWTPDGRSIAVLQFDLAGSSSPNIWLVDPGTGAHRPILGGPSLAGSDFTFSSDGKAFVVSDGDDKTLRLYNLANRNDSQVIGTGTMPAWEPARPATIQPGEQCFAETGFCIGGRFLEYWRANGGLALNGYPLTSEHREQLEDGNEYTVQYFERVRLELHPENAPPNDVLLGQFGRRIHPADRPVPPLSGATHFPETGHNVEGRFLEYWEANGGLRQFGYPITEEIQERLEDGNSYRVQYFERARFEYHPENAPPNDVLLGQFGRRILAEREARR